MKEDYDMDFYVCTTSQTKQSGSNRHVCWNFYEKLGKSDNFKKNELKFLQELVFQTLQRLSSIFFSKFRTSRTMVNNFMNKNVQKYEQKWNLGKIL